VRAARGRLAATARTAFARRTKQRPADEYEEAPSPQYEKPVEVERERVGVGAGGGD